VLLLFLFFQLLFFCNYKQTKSENREKALVVSTSLTMLATSQTPAYAYDLISFENIGGLLVWTFGIFIGVVGLMIIFLPFICGTLNPYQMLVNLGLVEGEVTNERKFKRNGDPMEHGTKPGHTWYVGYKGYMKGKDI
tara:strand:+ start:641 stop:1051 length:411 start_codon:yes stop_codon:yes gene_type:complete